MKDIIKHILKEDSKEKFFNMVAESFVKGATVYRINESFESSSELRDMFGYDDEMIEFAYSNYGEYGFEQDPEDEDSFYFKENYDNVLDIDEVIQDMFYIFIDKNVQNGYFIETPHGWEILTNDFEISTPYGHYVLEYRCRSKSYERIYRSSEVEKVLLEKYGLHKIDEQQYVSQLIYEKFITLLEPFRKVC